jgi:hypothetical protein
MDKRKAVIEKTLGIKISLGNFETLEVRESMTLDVEYLSHDDLERKDSNLTGFVTKMLKQSVEQAMQDIGRRRICKGQSVALWADGDQGPTKV